MIRGKVIMKSLDDLRRRTNRRIVDFLIAVFLWLEDAIWRVGRVRRQRLRQIEGNEWRRELVGGRQSMGIVPGRHRRWISTAKK